jgi:hypothetical protein
MTALGPTTERRHRIFYVAWIALFGCVGTVFAAGSKKRNLFVLLLGSLLFGGLLTQVACGGGSVQSGGGSPGTPPGTYTINVTGTSGSLQSAANVTLTVQ